MLGKLPVPGRPTILNIVGQGPTALAVGAGGGCLDIFTLIYPFSSPSPSLWETARYRLKYCLKGPLNPKQPTNQPNYFSHSKILKVSDPRAANSFLQRSNPHPRPVDYVLSLSGTLSRFTSKSRIPKSGKLCVFVIMYLYLSRFNCCCWQK